MYKEDGHEGRYPSMACDDDDNVNHGCHHHNDHNHGADMYKEIKN